MTAFIDLKRGDYGVEPICRALGVSASAYYQRKTGARSARSVEDERLLAVIRQTHKDNYYAYGYRKMWKTLLRAGESAPRCEVQRLPQRDQGAADRTRSVDHEDAVIDRDRRKDRTMASTLTTDNPTQSLLDELMTTQEVADTLRLRVSTIEDYARRGLIPSIKVGRHRRFLRSEVDTAIARLAGR